MQDMLDEPSSAAFEAQLRSYETDKLACRLKVCCLLQLVRTAHKCIASRSID